MRVTIVDLDWYNKESFLPNPKCMKLSSYHKQKEDLVLFALEELDFTYQFDVMYIVRESIRGKVPQGLNVLDKRVKLIGKGFRFFNGYQSDIDAVPAACRPDYTLYPIREENKMSKADVVQFYSGEERLGVIQNFENAYKKSHYTYVVDKDFWSKKTQDIEACVSLIQKSKNVVFKEPISLKNIIKRPDVKEIFLSLQFDPLFKLTMLNDCEIDDAESIIDFLAEVRKRNIKVKFEPIKIKSFINTNIGDDRKKNENALIRSLQIITKAMQNKVQIIMQGPDRSDTAFWFYFEELEAWTTYGHTYSFVEHMAGSAARTREIPIDRVLSDKQYWGSVELEMLSDLITFHPHIVADYGFIRWGGNKYVHPVLERIIQERLK